MSETSNSRMTVDEFLVWAENQSGHYELVDGRIWAMSPERVGHADTKFAVQIALRQAIGRAGLACHMLPDGVTVRIDAGTAYEPDALVYCGARLQPDAIEVPAPIIVVEVLSPSTGRYDRHDKLAGYFALPSLIHYLIINRDRRMMIHHERKGSEIATKILGSGFLRLDPPGLELTIGDLFGPLPENVP